MSNYCSKITTVKAGIIDPQYAHIFSFRRYVYINLDDIKKIPSTFLLTFEDTTYRIFTSIDSLYCFLQESYLTKNHPQNQESITSIDSTNSNKNSTIFSSMQSPKLPEKKITNITQTN